MPLGIDRSHFYEEKVKHIEKSNRVKDERIGSLETENAMLYLKLAQLRGALQHTRQESIEIHEQFEDESRFRKSVAESACKFKQELDNIKKDMQSVQSAAKEIPKQFNEQVQHANSVVQRHKMAFQSQSSSLSELQERLAHMELTLHDELRGNIRVHCRVRPLMDFDRGQEDMSSFGRQGAKSEVVVHFVDDENVCVRTTKHNKVFEYERVYDMTETQNGLFDEVQPMLTSPIIIGYNICIMAYGQTGSGKTHTMLGSHKNEDYNPTRETHPDEGVIPRAARELFRLTSEKQKGTHTVEVSVVEIYNNDIRDLLSHDPNIKHDINTGQDNSISLPTIISKQVDTVYDVMCLVQHGLHTRRESATMVHEHSSRSHLVVTLTVVSPAPSFFSKNSAPGDTTPRDSKGRSSSLSSSGSMPSGSMWQSNDISTNSAGQAVIKTKLQLVDLAGSECVGMSGVKGQALRETANINKSLSALADVLGALAEHRAHVPYRNTRLTHLLQDSIGGDAKLLILLCVAPAQRYITESLQSLGFGAR
ncbi:KIF25 [Mytilus edulis]|uniref:KIF25 n=1 Tax=Mytilus edulis TaxID=6550 RepID=A0A8S3R4Q2_MYTED|nr:KIF25 [Mytilus edulis]